MSLYLRGSLLPSYCMSTKNGDENFKLFRCVRQERISIRSPSVRLLVRRSVTPVRKTHFSAPELNQMIDKRVLRKASVCPSVSPHIVMCHMINTRRESQRHSPDHRCLVGLVLVCLGTAPVLVMHVGSTWNQHCSIDLWKCSNSFFKKSFFVNFKPSYEIKRMRDQILFLFGGAKRTKRVRDISISTWAALSQ